MRNIVRLTTLLVCLMPLSLQAAPRESLFFSQSELAAIMRANQGFVAPKAEKPVATGQQPVQDRGRRILTLSGIVYNGSKDWTIWLNGERVTPKNIPQNVKSLKVQQDSIRLRWHDVFYNRILNLTLRPHQQYNIDLDLIIPGTM